MSRKSLSFADAKLCYEELYPGSPFFETWIPEEKFDSAILTEESSLTLIRRDGDDYYGVLLGENPEWPSTMQKASVESRAADQFRTADSDTGEWDCYFAPTPTIGEMPDRRSTDQEIEDFLKEHAPESSVFPGDNEIQRWVEIYSEDELIAVAALCRWESGRIVLSSVATHSQKRGQGIGKILMNQSLQAARALGAEKLSLGVRHSNESAISLYKSTGFTLMHNFTYFERR